MKTYSEVEISVEYERWEKTFDKLEKDLDEFMIWFVKNRTCKCRLESGDSRKYAVCKHYEKLRNKLFGKKIDDSWQSLLNNRFKIMNNLLHESRNKDNQEDHKA